MTQNLDGRSAERLRGLVKKALIAKNEQSEARLHQWRDVLRLLKAYQTSKTRDASGYPEHASDICTPSREPKRSLIFRRENQAARKRSLPQQVSDFDFKRVKKRVMRGYCEVHEEFFDSIEYANWLKGRPWQLVCFGGPLCGKTTFTAAVAERLQQHTYEGKRAVIVLFLGRREARDQARRSLFEGNNPEQRIQLVLLAILRQLLECAVDQVHEMAMLEEWNGSDVLPNKLTPEDTRRHVQKAITTFNQVYIVVDGPEESADDFSVRMKELLLWMLDLKVNVLSVLATTIPEQLQISGCNVIECDYKDLVSLELYWQCTVCNDGDYYVCQDCKDQGRHCLVLLLDQKPRLPVFRARSAKDGILVSERALVADRNRVCSLHEIQEPYKRRVKTLDTPEAAMIHFIQQKLRADSSMVLDGQQASESIISSLNETIAQKAAGTILVANLFIEYVQQNQSIHDILNTLDDLPDTEMAAFRTFLTQVENQPEVRDKSLGLWALSMVAAAGREATYLTSEELVNGLSQQDVPGKSCGEETTIQEVLRVTGRFLIVAPDSELHVRPFHEDVLTFLYENVESPVDMAEICLATLVKASNFICSSEHSLSAKLKDVRENQPFLRYALQNWGLHLGASKGPNRHSSLQSFLQKYWNMSRNWQNIDMLTRDVNLCCEMVCLSKAIHVCAWFGFDEMLTTLRSFPFQEDIDEKAAVTGHSPLMIACLRNHVKCAEDLLRADANVTTVCSSGKTALWLTVEHSHRSFEAAELLIAKVDDTALNMRHPDFGGQTVLMLAIQKTKIQNSCSSKVLDLLLERLDVDLAVQDDQGKTAVHIATECNNHHAIQKLAVHSRSSAAILNMQDGLFARTALMYLLRREDWESTPAILKPSLEILVSSGASVDKVDRRGDTALHYAAARGTDAGNANVVEWLLLQQDIDVNKKNVEGNTPLHIACAFEADDILQCLLDSGADKAARNFKGQTALDVARLSRADTAVCLLGGPSHLSKQGRVVDTTDSGPNEPVWRRLQQDCDSETVSFADEYKSGLTAISDKAIHDISPRGSTALHVAVEMGDLPAVQLLLSNRRIDANRVDKLGRTALQLAVEDLATFEWPEEAIHQLPIIDALTDAVLDIRVDQRDYDGRGLLDVTQRETFEYIANRLLQHEPAPTITQLQAQRMLTCYCARGEQTTLEKLFDLGAEASRLFKMTMRLSEWALQDGAGSARVEWLRNKEIEALEMPRAALS